MNNIEKEFYKSDDFYRLKKIDAHVHINTVSTQLLDQAEKDNFKLITINIDYPDFPPIKDQEKIAIGLIKQYPNQLSFASTFYMKGWDEPDWVNRTIEYINTMVKAGAVAVKAWKNIGMSFRDKNGKLIMIDDSKLDAIFNYLKESKIPLIGHQGEPKNCWFPLEKMTVNDDRDYYRNHPQYHMFLHPEMPSYENQIEARDHMLKKNKDIVFIGAHFASLEWSIQKISEFLRKFPKSYVDIAGRISSLQNQSINNYKIVRKFFIEFKNRILYATDLMQENDNNPESFANEAHNQWIRDWEYFCTDSIINVPNFDKPVKGLNLPVDVINRMYWMNAQKVFPKLKLMNKNDLKITDGVNYD